MADIDYFDDGYRYGARHPYDRPPIYEDDLDGAHMGSGRLFRWFGALMSIAIVGGMCFWAWELMARDVTNVPIIQALEGPTRVRPDDPGGIEMPNQGLSVNRIVEGGEAAPTSDRVVLAPPPVEIAAVDLASTVALMSDDQLSQLTPNVGEDGAGVAPALQTAAVFVQGGVGRSVRPSTRPATLRVQSAQTTTPILSTSEGVDLSPADLLPGTRLVQLGAFDSTATAQREWDILAGRFPEFLGGRHRVIERASVSGQIFYRLRAHGFDNLAQTRDFCAQLVARGAACIPVLVR